MRGESLLETLEVYMEVFAKQNETIQALEQAFYKLTEELHHLKTVHGLTDLNDSTHSLVDGVGRKIIEYKELIGAE